MATKEHYTSEQLDEFALADLRQDVQTAEYQAANGPFYPELGVTREMCLQYAADCRAKIEQYKTPGAHASDCAIWIYSVAARLPNPHGS